MSRRAPSHSFSTFAEFWTYYVSEHQHPGNRTLHVVGTLGGIACIALTIGVSRWWGLAILPVGYGPAWLGHILIERNLPVTLSYPLWSLRADYRMVLTLLSGRPLGVNQADSTVSNRRAA